MPRATIEESSCNERVYDTPINILWRTRRCASCEKRKSGKIALVCADCFVTTAQLRHWHLHCKRHAKSNGIFTN